MAAPFRSIRSSAPTHATRVPFFVPLFNPIARRLMRFGMPLGPNALLTVNGRTSGVPRTTPVAVVAIGGHRWIIGTFGEVNWVRNLRVAGTATLTQKRRQESVRAVELSPEQAAAFYSDTLGPFVRRIPLGPWLIGTVLGARDILTDPAGAAKLHPVFQISPA